jgi:hypothetical protein
VEAQHLHDSPRRTWISGKRTLVQVYELGYAQPESRACGCCWNWCSWAVLCAVSGLGRSSKVLRLLTIELGGNLLYLYVSWLSLKCWIPWVLRGHFMEPWWCHGGYFGVLGDRGHLRRLQVSTMSWPLICLKLRVLGNERFQFQFKSGQVHFVHFTSAAEIEFYCITRVSYSNSNNAVTNRIPVCWVHFRQFYF